MVKLAIVVARFNGAISKSLLKACLVELKRAGVKDQHITTVWVPGSFEIPLMALKLAKKKNVDAVICLGAVIRGQTYHFEVVANGTVGGIMDVALRAEKPVILGVLTTNTVAQAHKRAQSKGSDNKGREAAQVALEMVGLCAVVR